MRAYQDNWKIHKIDDAAHKNVRSCFNGSKSTAKCVRISSLFFIYACQQPMVTFFFLGCLPLLLLLSSNEMDRIFIICVDVFLLQIIFHTCTPNSTYLHRFTATYRIDSIIVFIYFFLLMCISFRIIFAFYYSFRTRFLLNNW